MTLYTPEQIYNAARAMLSMLDEDRRQQMRSLLQEADNGADTHMQVLDLLTRDDATLEQLRRLLGIKGIDTFRTLGYAGAAGEPMITKPGAVYVCPVEGCTERYVIGEAGETPPPCPKHHTPLVPEWAS